jgi:ArsR family transcriptional regulator, arsenate/arsenite/antimonite-responsive transcriptional repressor
VGSPTTALPVLQAAECCTPLGEPAMSEEDARTTAAVFKALADPNRVRIFNQLATSAAPVCVCDITDHIELAQPTTSFHLKKLVSAGLLHREQRGTWAYYSINREVIGRLRSIFDLKEAVA